MILPRGTAPLTVSGDAASRRVLVEGTVGEGISATIALSFDVGDHHLAKAAEELFRPPMKREQLWLLDPVGAVDLLDHELRVEVNLKPIRLPLRHRLQPLDEGLVLGFVVGGLSDIPVQSAEPKSLVILDDHADPGRARIPAGRAVREQAQRLQASTRMRLQFSQWTSSSTPLRNSCMPEDVTVTRQAVHWLFRTLATGGWARVRE